MGITEFSSPPIGLPSASFVTVRVTPTPSCRAKFVSVCVPSGFVVSRIWPAPSRARSEALSGPSLPSTESELEELTTSQAVGAPTPFSPGCGSVPEPATSA